MKFSKHIRFVGESFGAGIAFLVIPILSRRLALSLSRAVADMAFSCCSRLRRVAMSNLDIAFGSDLSVDRKHEIIRGSFRSFSLLIVDLFWFARFTEKRINRWVKFDESYSHYWDNAPAVVITAHMGNWEVLGQAVSLHGSPITSVATPLKNAVVDKILVRMRKVTGQQVVPREGAIRSILKVLRTKGRTALLMDQNTLPEDGGRFVDFFGLPVPNSDAAATLASRTDSAIVFVYCIADDDGVYRGYALEPFKVGDLPDGEEGVTQKLSIMTEDIIKKHPEKWMWMYKRWKYIPSGASRDSYPFYARILERIEK